MKENRTNRLYDLEEQEERFILIGVSLSDNDDTADSLEELSELVDTAGGRTVGTVIRTEKRFILQPISEKVR